MSTPVLTAERLREILVYDPDTGIFLWKAPPNQRIRVGAVAGYVNHHGGRLIGIEGRYYQAHRLAWLYVDGEWPGSISWPSRGLDQKNRNRDDNRLVNLHLATQSQNSGNKCRQKNNKSGYKGVSWHSGSGRWPACIKGHGGNRHLGLFVTPEEAHEAYCKAVHKLHGEFARVANRRVWR
jgi:hypothetical protein